MTTHDRRTFIELARQFRTGMLVTFDATGGLAGRPMVVARVDDEGGIWFVTTRDADLVDELLEIERAAVELQAATLHMHVYGRMSVHLDAEHARAAWSPALRAWFPDGVDSDDVAVLRLEPTSADWWNLRAGQVVRFGFELVKAVVTGQAAPTDAPGERGHEAF